MGRGDFLRFAFSLVVVAALGGCVPQDTGPSTVTPSPGYDGGTAVSTCGGTGESCCSGTACQSGLLCTGGTCQPICGAEGEACCGNSACNAGLSCRSGTCQVPCGRNGESCCGGTTCTGTLSCQADGKCHTTTTTYASGTLLLSCGCWGSISGCVSDARCTSGIACPNPNECAGLCGAGGYPYTMRCY